MGAFLMGSRREIEWEEARASHNCRQKRGNFWRPKSSGASRVRRRSSLKQPPCQIWFSYASERPNRSVFKALQLLRQLGRARLFEEKSALDCKIDLFSGSVSHRVKRIRELRPMTATMKDQATYVRDSCGRRSWCPSTFRQARARSTLKIVPCAAART